MMKKNGAYKNVLRAVVSFIRGSILDTRTGSKSDLYQSEARNSKDSTKELICQKKKSTSTSTLAHKLSVPQLMA